MGTYTIIIVGCGATGSNIATFVSQLAVSENRISEIILIDGDIVERKNFRNQKFTEKDVNRNKAQVLSNRYIKLGINISYIDKYLRDSNELIKLIKDLSRKSNVILVGSVDNNNARIMMNETFYSDEISDLIYIDTGNGDKDKVGQTVLAAKANKQVIKPPVADYYPQILQGDKKEKVSYKCSRIEEHPQNLATNLLSATTTFMLINNVISQNKIKYCHYRFDADNVVINAK